MEIEIKTDMVKLMTSLGDLKSKQLPYAVSKTLNILATNAAGLMRREFQGKMEVRNKGLLKKGIQVEFANKKQWPFSASEVGTNKNFDFLDDHISGAKRVGRGSLGRAVPNKQLIVRAPSGKVKPKDRPKALLKKKKGVNGAFLVTFKSGKRAIVRRQSEGRLPLDVLFTLRKEVKVKSTVEFFDLASRFFTKEYDKVLGQELAAAIASKKK